MAITFSRPGGSGGGGGGGTAFEPLWKQIHDGTVTDVERITLFGFNAAPANSTWSTYDVNIADPSDARLSSAQQLQIVSDSIADTSAGTGARTILITGLDANYAEISETITMNGTTNVTTTNSYLRLNHMVVKTVGSNNRAVGEITASNNADTQVICSIPEVYSYSLNNNTSTLYTVPAGKTLYVTDIAVGTNGASISGAHVVFRAYPNTTNAGFETIFQLSGWDDDNGCMFSHSFGESPLSVTEQVDLGAALIVTAAGVQSTFNLTGFLVNDPA